MRAIGNVALSLLDGVKALRSFNVKRGLAQLISESEQQEFDRQVEIVAQRELHQRTKGWEV